MKISDNGIDKLIEWEGCRLYAYDDRTAVRVRHWIPQATIGVGHLIPENEWHKFKDGITLAYAIKLFIKDVDPRSEYVNKKLKVPVNQNQFDALVSLCFNIGCGNFKRSSVLAMINDPLNHGRKYDSLESAWKAWHKANGKSHVLDNRRSLEWSLYNE
jgi:type VI secretion system secreted protein VgrG